jgi:hypothetical protein
MRLPAFLARLHTRKDLAALRSQDQTASIVAALLDLEGPGRRPRRRAATTIGACDSVILAHDPPVD